MQKENKIQYNKGAAMMITVFFFVFISLTILIGIVTPVVREFRIVGNNFDSKKSYFLAESGVEDAFYRIKNNKKIYTTGTLTIGTDTATIVITSIGNSQKRIDSLGDSNSNQRKVSLLLGVGDGIVFRYGTQAGQGGILFKNNAYLNGSLYSNGNIVGANNAYITGDAIVAGNTGSISNMRIGYGGVGMAHAYSVTSSTITGALYCQVGSSNNKNCDTSRPNPEVIPLPINNENIEEWKNDAMFGGILSGNQTISTPTALGPKKIVGNLAVNSPLTITDTIWVTGNITINSSVTLSSSYGVNSGIIIADGIITIANGVVFNDSGTAGSYIMVLSTSTCDSSISTSPCYSSDAIEISNNSNIIIANAQSGTVSFSNNATVKEVVGNKITLKNNVGITYGSGVANINFTSGPAGSWDIFSWKEIQ